MSLVDKSLDCNALNASILYSRLLEQNSRMNKPKAHHKYVKRKSGI
jgi:hypothetical protein